MRIYIASKYVDNKNINRNIADALRENGYEVFLPETINIDALDADSMTSVAERCYQEIDMCDVIIFVYPFGKSVACEFGYTISMKRLMKKDITIISYAFIPDNEAMYTPYIDKKVDTITELIKYLKTISKE